MTRYLRLVAVQARISIAQAMAYRSDFIIEGLMSAAWLFVALMPYFVLFDGRQSVAGWDAPSALVVMAYFMGIRAVLEGIVSPSIVDLVERIRSGAFDYVLLKPADAQALVSTSRYEPWKIFDLLGAVFDTARWPVQVFRGAWRIVFTLVIPVAVMTTYPAMALLGRLDATTALAAIGGAIAMLVISRVIWRAAIRNYTSASS